MCSLFNILVGSYLIVAYIILEIRIIVARFADALSLNKNCRRSRLKLAPEALRLHPQFVNALF
jgi:hypothetical protein